MSMSDTDANDSELCGVETTKGHPCQNKAESCPWHNTDNPPENGRKTKLDKATQEAICGAIEKGRSLQCASRKAGISPATVYNWLEWGEEQDEGIFNDFLERFTRAKGQGEEFYFNHVIELALDDGDHRFIASLMKQRHPDAWQETETGVDADKVELIMQSDASKYEPSTNKH